MTTAAHRDLAAWLLAQEMGNDSTPGSVYEAAERVCQEMGRRLTELVTAEGYRALLARAVHLARPEFPFLRPITSGSATDSCLAALRTPPDDLDPAMSHGAYTAVLGGVIALVTTFIGEELALRVVRDAWPDASLGDRGPRLEEART